MKCNHCGDEFGNGSVCQHCGADKVSALGEFCGYSFTKNIPKTAQHTSIEHNPSTSSMPSVVDIPSLICWKCGEVIPRDSKYCPTCGTLLFVTCPSCGHKYPANFIYCNQCGINRENYQKAKELQEEIILRAEEAELQRKRQEEALRQAEKEKQAHQHETDNKKDRSFKKHNPHPINTPNNTVYYLALAYIREMTASFEHETFFINLAFEVKQDYMERYLSNHYIIDPGVDNVVRTIIKDKTYWERRDCLDMNSLQEECVKGVMAVYKTLIAVY